MKINELIEQVSKSQPKLLANMPKKKVEKLVHTILENMRRKINSTEDGVVMFGGLGRFRVRKIEREVDGEIVIRKHVVFIGAKAKKQDAKGAAE